MHSLYLPLSLFYLFLLKSLPFSLPLSHKQPHSMYLSLCLLLMPARKYATFILWPQPVSTCVCVRVRVKSVSTATPTGSMQHLFTLSPLPLCLPIYQLHVMLRCLLLHVACVDIFATLTFYILQQFLSFHPTPPIPVLAETVP